jgi:hypothetical protein
MSIAEKLTTIAENEQKVYEAGQKAEYDRFWDNFLDYGNRTDYQHAFAGAGWNNETFKPKYDLIDSAYTNRMFFNTGEIDVCARLKECGVTIDISQSTGITYIAYGGDILTLPVLDCRKKPNLTYFLCQTRKLKSVEKVILKNDGSQAFGVNTSFGDLYALEEIRFEGVIGQDISFKNCTLLTHESLMSIINALKDFRLVNSTYSNVTYEWDGTEGNGEIGKVYETDNIAPDSEYIEFQYSWGTDLVTDYHVIVLRVRNLNITEEELSKVKTFMIDSNGNLVLGINQGNPTTTKTLTIGSTNLEKLTDAEKKIATDKGWTLA